MRSRIAAIAGLGVLNALAVAQAPPAPPPPPAAPGAPGAPAGAPAPLHWAQQLGLRAENINRAFPIIDRVVLVPDAATYLDEIARWSPAGRWPVLIEDSRYAPMFVRRFAPAHVLRRDSVGALPADPETRRKLIEEAVIRGWSGDPGVHTVRNVFEATAHFIPPGVVITSVTDPAWTAAVALASGHGQPVLFLDGDFGTSGRALPTSEVNALGSKIDSLVTDLGYRYAALGDDIDAITICRQVCGRMRIQDPGVAEKDSKFFAITDVLGRNPGGSRYAFVGWIFGNETRCAYVAMCSLFLPRQRAWLYNAYPTSSQPWAAYDVAEPAGILRKIGFETTEISGAGATSQAWLAKLPGGLATDVIIVNTKGNSGFFEMFAKNDWCYPSDVPILDEPAAVHFIHSWSMQQPDSTATIAGKWLDRGAYAYVGSVHEPGLQAFLPPEELVRRWASGMPFLVSARLWDSPPWRINTYGDPLMLCQSPTDAPRKRIDQPPALAPGNNAGPAPGTNAGPAPGTNSGAASVPAPAPAVGYVDLNELVKQLMTAAKTDETGRSFADAITLLDLLGRDEIAIGMWRAAQQKGASELASRAALGALFRSRDVNAFMKAWGDLPQHDDLAVDMLWHLLLPRLSTIVDKDILLQLQGSIRKPDPSIDLGRLVPHLTAVFGQGHARGVVQREIDHTDNEGIRKRLQALMK